MNALWWNQIRRQLGLERLSQNEATDQFLAMSLVDLDDWLFQVAYGRMEESNIHPYNDERFWLSTV